MLLGREILFSNIVGIFQVKDNVVDDGGVFVEFDALELGEQLPDF